MLSVKFWGLIFGLCLKLCVLSMGEECGIFGVEVKFVDIGRNFRGEGDVLDYY